MGEDLKSWRGNTRGQVACSPLWGGAWARVMDDMTTGAVGGGGGKGEEEGGGGSGIGSIRGAGAGASMAVEGDDDGAEMAEDEEEVEGKDDNGDGMDTEDDEEGETMQEGEGGNAGQAGGKKSNVCEVCGRGFASQSSLTRHALMHSGDRRSLSGVTAGARGAEVGSQHDPRARVCRGWEVTLDMWVRDCTRPQRCGVGGDAGASAAAQERAWGWGRQQALTRGVSRVCQSETRFKAHVENAVDSGRMCYQVIRDLN